VMLLLAGLLPVCLLAPAIQTYLATFATSFKEAQSYMGILLIVPMLPGIIGSMYQLTGQPWMYPVPILGQHVIASDAIAARATPAWAFFVAAVSAVIVSLMLVALTTALLRRERILFTR